jgi:hypothetical protein
MQASSDADHGGYRLPESAYEQLQDLRDQLDLLARLATAVTAAEEATAPLTLPRSLLGACFQRLGERLEQALAAVEWVSPPPR